MFIKDIPITWSPSCQVLAISVQNLIIQPIIVSYNTYPNVNTNISSCNGKIILFTAISVIELVDLDPNAAPTLAKLTENGKILFPKSEDNNHSRSSTLLRRDSALRRSGSFGSNTEITSHRKSSTDNPKSPRRKNSMLRNSEDISHTFMRNDSFLRNSQEHSKYVKPLVKRDSILKTFQWIKLNQSMAGDKVTYATSGWYQFCILLRRLLLHNVRNRKALIIQAVHYFICAVILGIVYYDQADNGAFMFNHLKFSLGFIMFYSHTRLFIPIILCKFLMKSCILQN